jgi:hypothetical protein
MDFLEIALDAVGYFLSISANTSGDDAGGHKSLAATGQPSANMYYFFGQLAFATASSGG